MNGLYVNQNFEVVFISARSYENGKTIDWFVQGGDWNAVMEATDASQTTFLMNGIEGTYDSDKRIVWSSDIGVWTRTTMSSGQYKVLVYRPYIPFSVVLLSFMCSVGKWAVDRVASVVSREKAKK